MRRPPKRSRTRGSAFSQEAQVAYEQAVQSAVAQVEAMAAAKAEEMAAMHAQERETMIRAHADEVTELKKKCDELASKGEALMVDIEDLVKVEGEVSLASSAKHAKEMGELQQRLEEAEAREAFLRETAEASITQVRESGAVEMDTLVQERVAAAIKATVHECEITTTALLKEARELGEKRERIALEQALVEQAARFREEHAARQHELEELRITTTSTIALLPPPNSSELDDVEPPPRAPAPPPPKQLGMSRHAQLAAQHDDDDDDEPPPHEVIVLRGGKPPPRAIEMSNAAVASASSFASTLVPSSPAARAASGLDLD